LGSKTATGIEARQLDSTVAAGTSEDVLVIREWNLLQLGVFELKYYAPGVGLILEEVEESGEGRIELVGSTLAG
jgi:hypothetical protein